MIDNYFNNGKFSKNYALKIIKNKRDYGIYKYFKSYVSFAPSEAISRKIGIDVHKEWLLPYNLSPTEFELILVGFENNINKILFDECLKLNKDIKNIIDNINYLDEDNIFNILFGISSKFNESDIISFCNGGIYSHMSDEWYHILGLCEHKLGDKIQYVPSEETLDIIYNELFK